MSEWITDRRPTEGDCAAPHYCVYDAMGWIVHYRLIWDGAPWKPVPKCEPYEKPKRWSVVWSELFGGWSLRNIVNGGVVHLFDPMLKCGLSDYTNKHREAAERIAAIYEEVMP